MRERDLTEIERKKMRERERPDGNRKKENERKRDLTVGEIKGQTLWKQSQRYRET